jgi:ferrochelatase
MPSSKKTGVLISNLGSPDAPTKKALRSYLKQFLSDKRVIQPVVGRLGWWLILNVIILNTRPKKSAKLYQSIWNKFGKGAPLVDISYKQLVALREKFDGSSFEFALAMRYGSPSIARGVTELMQKGVDEIIVFPLYPQYSRTTTESTFDEIHCIEKTEINVPKMRLIKDYHDNPLYIQALKKSVLAYQKIHGKPQKLIISFHGIPKIYVENGDIYPQQCQKTADLLVKSLQLKPDEYLVCYQSIFGKLEWIKPYLDATLKSLPSQGIKDVQVICPGFAADCLETLEEIEHENKEYFLTAGGEKYSYIPALNDSDEHIECLFSIINDKVCS